MISTRPLFRWFLAFVFAAFAVPGFAAPEKKYTLDVQPANISAGVQKLTFTIKNITPGGNSNINSMKIYLPTSGYAIDNPSGGAHAPSSPNWTINNILAPDGGTVVSLWNMTSVKPTQSFTFYLWVNVTAAACSSGSWVVQPMASAWTGNSFSGDPFRQVYAPEAAVNTTTTLGGSTSIALSDAYVSASSPVKGTAFDATVTLSNSCGTAIPVTKVTLTATGRNATINTQSNTADATTNTNGDGTVTFSVNFSQFSPPDATLTASASGYGSAAKTFTVYGGSLDCEGSGNDFDFMDIPGTNTEPLAPGDAAGKRGSDNKDGSPCAAVGYQFFNTILVNNQAEFVWNTSNGQEGAAFEYTVVWKPEYVNATSGMPDRVTKVKWAAMGAASPVAARACLSPSLPKKLATLDASALTDGKLPAGDLSLKVTGAGTLPQGKFPIMIGKERLLVTAVSGSTWTVERGDGGTTAAEHPDGAKIMSTPLPLDGSGNVMLMCVVQESWTSAPAGDADCSVPDASEGSNPPRACVLMKTTIFDIGDGLIIRGGT